MQNTRREFLKTASAMAAAGAAIGAPTLGVQQAFGATAGGARTSHELPSLPYAYDALEPYIDAQTMELHHSAHHMAYVNGLNNAEEMLAQAREAGDFAQVQHWSRQVAFHGGGHFLHSLFWMVMAPPDNGGGGEPEGSLAEKIEEDFGGFDQFKAHFSAAAGAVEGGGWGLLHYRFPDDRLVVMQAENQHKLSLWASVPILGVDVWEHAYYLNYQNRRGEYIENWWNVVNWSAVSEIFTRSRSAAQQVVG